MLSFRPFRSKIGLRLMLYMGVILVGTLITISYIGARQFISFGRYAAQVNETGFQENALAFLERITREQALRYETTFQGITAAAGFIAGQASFLFDHCEMFGQQARDPADMLRAGKRRGIFTNSTAGMTMVNYWGAGELDADAVILHNCLSFFDPMLRDIQRKIPESAAAYIITESGMQRYFPNIADRTDLPPATEYDMRYENYYVSAGPYMNPGRKTVWTSIYQSSAGHGLVITAASPVYTSDGMYQGAVGIDVTLQGIVSDVLGGSEPGKHHELAPMAPFLVDDVGVVIAMPPAVMETLGIGTTDTRHELPGVVLVHSLLDSDFREIREFGQNMLAARYQSTRVALGSAAYILSAHSMPSTGWRFCVLVPEQSLLQSVADTRRKLGATGRQLNRQLMLVALGAFVAAFLLASLLLRSFIGPLNDLTRAAARVRDGDLRARIHGARSDEIGLLASAFNDMVTGLAEARTAEEQYTRRLETKVRERTREISDKNSQLEQTLQDLGIEMASRRRTEADLRAANRQLRYREQELNAANQQLLASEIGLRESHEFIENVFETTGDGIFITDTAGSIIRVNNMGGAMTGSREGELTGRNLSELTGAGPCASEQPPVLERFMETGAITSFETGLMHSNGTLLPVEINANILRDPEGAATGMVWSMRDISERLQAEQEQARLIAAIEQASELIILMGPDGTLQYMNPSASRVTGCRLETAVGNKVFAAGCPFHDMRQCEEISGAIRNGMNWNGQVQVKMSGGDTCYLEMTLSPIRDRSGAITCFVSISRDVSTEMKMQQDLRQAQKMEAIGTLAGGIAHDFNNILAVIIGYVELSLIEVGSGSRLQKNLSQALTAAERAQHLVDQILTFSRQSEQEKRPISVTPLVKETVKFLRASLPATISIEQHLAARNDIVLSDPVQVQQILMNLCTNAKHAMQDGGGVLRIETSEECPAGDAGLDPLAMEPGWYLKLSVHDTGCGMEAAVLNKMYDPFFTTKPPGEGTGLGLSVVHGIVKSCGGHIRARSAPGQGTRFDVYLPRAEEQAQEEQSRRHGDVCGGSEHVLVVDDEQEIARMLQQMLESLGYRVTARTSSIEALHCFQNQPDAYDIVITDQTMPNMTGAELARCLLDIRPQLPIILCTGYSERVTEPVALSMGIRCYMLKPIIRADLAAAIRQSLERTPEAVS